MHRFERSTISGRNLKNFRASWKAWKKSDKMVQRVFFWNSTASGTDSLLPILEQRRRARSSPHQTAHPADARIQAIRDCGSDDSGHRVSREDQEKPIQPQTADQKRGDRSSALGGDLGGIEPRKSFCQTEQHLSGIAPEPLTSQQHQALLTIKGFPDGTSITIGQLAEQLQVAHHTAVELVDRLALQNLVFRETGTLDRRHVYIKLTERGLEIIETLTWANREELRRLSTRLNSFF